MSEAQTTAVMSKGDWAKVEQDLSFPFGSVKLNCDGYLLSLLVCQSKPLKQVILFYVNGRFEGTFLTQDCEERRRFARPQKIALWKPSEKARLTKGFTKRVLAKHFSDINKTFTHYDWTWPSFAPLKRHLIANNKVISLVEAL